MSMLTINPDSTKLLQGRIDACTIITDFLISIQKNWKNFALNYIRSEQSYSILSSLIFTSLSYRKIKVIQRKWRRHMLQNHFRYLLILSYIEKLIPFLFIHFSFILNGKGYDVQNLLANDMNQLSNSLKYYSFYSITEHIDSSHFHKFLRDINSQHHNPNVLSQILKFFGLLIHSPVHQQHHPKRVEANSNTAISATPKGKLRPTPPSIPSRGFPGHHNHHGKSNSIGAAAQQIRPYAGLSAINPAVGTIPHPFFSTPEFMELQNPSNYLHQHNIRILTYHATPDPTYHQQYSSNMNFHQTISSQHPFGYSYHKHYTLFDIIVKQCILQFIYKKRAKFIDKMDVNNPVLTHFKFDVNDIKSFIHGEGYDPLQVQLETMMKKQEASFLQHQNYQIQKSLPYGSVKAGSTVVPGGSIAVGSGPGGGNSEIRNAMAEAIATVEQSSSNVPFTSITKDEGRPLAQQRSLLNQQDMEDFDVFGNPHVYKTSQITMLLLSEITAEDIIQLLIEITQILQLIPAPYLGNSNYNQSYIQLLRNQYLKNLKPVEIRKTITTKVPRLSGIDPFNSVMDDRAVVEQELNPSMISSFLFVDDSPVQTPAIVESKGRRGNSTIQKGVPQQLALLVQSNELYRDVYEFFHHYVGRQFPLSSAPTHRSSNATNDLAETRSSREGSVSSQASGASNPVSVAAIAAAAAARQRNAAGANPAQIANLRKSILAGRSDMHRLSVAVASQHAKGAEFLKRKTSVIPENQRKYGKNRRTEGDFDENEDEDDDEEEESDTFGSPLRLSPKQPMRPNFLRKSSVMPVANQHRKLSTLGNK